MFEIVSISDLFPMRAQVEQVRLAIECFLIRAFEMRDVIKLFSLLPSHMDLNHRGELRDPGVSSCSASRQ